jgi:hypothetical protein
MIMQNWHRCAGVLNTDSKAPIKHAAGLEPPAEQAVYAA